MIGMCKSHYLWKQDQIFLWNRPWNIPSAFRPNPLAVCVIIQKQYSFNHDSGWRTLFLNIIPAKGVFHWSIQIKYGLSTFSRFAIGSAPTEVVKELHGGHLGALFSPGDYSRNKVNGSCSLGCWGGVALVSGCMLWGVVDNSDIPTNETQVPDLSFVSVELDTAARTLFFFVDGKKIPRGVSHVNGPYNLGISGYEHFSFTPLSFRRLPADTPTHAPCKMHRCNPCVCMPNKLRTYRRQKKK